MFFRRKKKQEPATTKATGSPSCCDCLIHRNPIKSDELPESHETRSVVGMKQDRHTGAQQKLISSILSSDLDPADYSALRDLLDLRAKNREVLILIDPDLVTSVKKLLRH